MTAQNCRLKNSLLKRQTDILKQKTQVKDCIVRSALARVQQSIHQEKEHYTCRH